MEPFAQTSNEMEGKSVTMAPVCIACVSLAFPLYNQIRMPKVICKSCTVDYIKKLHYMPLRVLRGRGRNPRRVQGTGSAVRANNVL